MDAESLADALGGKERAGKGFMAFCPAHENTNTPALSINEINGKILVKCFGPCNQTDVIDALRSKGLWTNGKDTAILTPSPRSKPKPKPSDEPSVAPPKDAPTPDCKHFKLGKPSKIWSYLDADASQLFHVARYETPTGKTLRPWTWDSHAGKWRCKGWVGKRPIYNQDLLKSHADKGILVTEGEKSCEAAQSLTNRVTTTWHGGVNSWDKADWTPVYGRKILLWPDSDEPGIACMEALASHLHPHCTEVRILRVARDGKGEDAADLIDQGYTLKSAAAWAKERVYLWVPKPHAPSPVEQVAESPTFLEDPSQLPESAPQLPLEDPYNMPLTDGGNIDRLWFWFKDELIYTAMGWWHWGGKYWELERGAENVRLQALPLFNRLQTAAKKEMDRHIVGSVDHDIAKAKQKFFKECQNLAKIKAMLELGQGKFRREDTVFDANPDLFNFENGTMNLRTATLAPHCKEDLMTKTAGYDVLTDGDCPNFKKLICEAMAQDDNKIQFLYHLLGSAMSGNTKDQVILMNHGTGSNGKSTLFDEVMLKVTGDYGKAINVRSFLDSQSSRAVGPRPDLIALMGVRYGTMSEPPEGASLDEALIKSFTGGDLVSARDLHKGTTEFLPCLHMFMSYNLEPRLKDFSQGMVRRLKKLSWPIQFSKNEDFKASLVSEVPAIAWFLTLCCREWYEKGLTVPEIVDIDTREYMLAQNIVAQFAEMYLQKVEGMACSNADLYETFVKACKENGWDELSHSKLTRRMRDMGYKQYTSHNTRRWKDTVIVAPEVTEEPPEPDDWRNS